MGAGGGGFLLLCAAEGKRKQLRIAMENMGLKFMDFEFDFEGAKVLVNMQDTTSRIATASLHYFKNQDFFRAEK